MTVAALDILARLADLGAKIERHGDKLLLEAGDVPVPREILATIREHKAEVLQVLAGDASAAQIHWTDEHDERAAILEYDAGMPRTWAEELARLNCSDPPGDVPPRRWLQFIEDGGQFVEEWAETAIGLGWQPQDLFGCDQNKPFARIDRAGLIWLLNGDRLLFLAHDAAGIKTKSGARQTYRRRDRFPGEVVLPWELNP